MTALASIVPAADGRYVVAAYESETAWHIYVAWESADLRRRRTCWWHAPAIWDASLAAAIQRAWDQPHLHVQLLDYDTPDEDTEAQESMAESCMLTVRVRSSHRSIRPRAPTSSPSCRAAHTTRPVLVCRCWPRYAIHLTQLSLLLNATADAARTRQATMEQALQAAQAALDAERAKYREVCTCTNTAPCGPPRDTRVVLVVLARAPRAHPVRCTTNPDATPMWVALRATRSTMQLQRAGAPAPSPARLHGRCATRRATRARPSPW